MNIRWFKHNDKDWWGMRSTPAGIWLANVVRVPDAKPRVLTAQLEPTSLDNAKALKALKDKFKLDKANLSYLLGFDDYQFAQIEKPAVPEAEQKQAIGWVMQNMIDYPIEEATVDFMDIPPNPNGGSNSLQYTFAISAQNQLIATLSNQLIAAGINLKAIDARAMAQRNIANLLAQGDEGIAMLSFANNMALLTFSAGGELFHVRRIQLYGEQDDSIFEKIALEIQRSFHKFEAEISYVVVRKIIVAPFNEYQELCSFLSNYLSIQVESFSLTDIFDFDNNVQLGTLSEQSSLLPVLGAALREELAR